jgi:hypothetical protein
VVTTDEWLTAAIHESGHCAAYFRFNWPFYSVSIFEVHGEVLGSVHAPAGRYNCTAKAVACLAGPLAEELHSGIGFAELARAGSRTDIAMAQDALSRIGSPDFDRLLPFARSLVAQDWPFIRLITAALLQYRQLDYAEVLQLVR